MEAEVCDWLVVKGPIVDRCERRGLITEVHSADGTPPFVVRWLDTGHEAMVFPGPDALVVTAAEQRSADERARERMSQTQATIRGS